MGERGHWLGKRYINAVRIEKRSPGLRGKAFLSDPYDGGLIQTLFADGSTEPMLCDNALRRFIARPMNREG